MGAAEHETDLENTDLENIVERALRKAAPHGWSVTKVLSSYTLSTKRGETCWELQKNPPEHRGVLSHSVVLTRHRDRLLVSNQLPPDRMGVEWD